MEKPSSYRLISLTFHVGKVLGGKMILSRLAHYSEKNIIIPVNQTGFRKGRSTIDHLVKLTTHVKKQFARTKRTLATFFGVRKASDKVWHATEIHRTFWKYDIPSKIFCPIGQFKLG